MNVLRDRVGRTPGGLPGIYLAIGALAIGAYFFLPGLRGNGLLFNLVGLSAAGAIALGVRLHRPATRSPWYLFMAGMLFFVAGDAYYYSYPAVTGTDVPFPSPADVLYLAVYPCLVAGMAILIRRRSPEGDRSGLLDALTITTAVALLSYVFLIEPYVVEEELDFFSKLVSILYPAMDVTLLAFAVRLVVSGGVRRTAPAFLVASCLALLATDAALGVLTIFFGGHEEGGPLDLGWALFYLLWGAAALHRSMQTLDVPLPIRDARLSRRRLAMLTVASLAAPGLQTVQSLRGQPVVWYVIAIGSTLLFCLAMLRMAGLLRTSDESAARERALRHAGDALVTSTGRDEIHKAGLAAMLALAGPDHHARIATFAPSGELRMLSDDGGEWQLRATDLVVLDARRLREQRSLEVVLDHVGLRPTLRLPEQVEVLVVFPLFVQSDLRGLAFVAGPHAADPQLQQAMQILAVNIALALESSVLTEDLLLRKGQSRFESLVKHASDLITVIGADTTINYQSPSVEHVLGYEPEELLGTRFTGLLHPAERDHVTAVIADAMTSAHPQAEVIECRLRHADGSWLLFELLRTNLLDDPNVEGIVLNARDISERKRFEEQLAHQAFHDPVTELANRALFTDRVHHALTRQVREGGRIAIMFADLDDFKMVNDSLGHAAGDEVLAEVGRRLSGCIRPTDTVARFGGDEFAILFEDHQCGEDLEEVAQRILGVLETPVMVEGKEVTTRASIGIAAIAGEDAMTTGAEDLLRNADVAMYMAKRDGKGRFRRFEPSMHADVVNRLELTGALQRSIDDGHFELRYQPIVDLEQGRLSGFEALVRWHHPERGEVSPSEFIPIAEETGLIVPLGTFVLQQACREAVFLQEMVLADPPLTMSVNISVKQLQQPDFRSVLVEILRETGLDPSRLVLEITESLLMIDTEAAVQVLSELKDAGVRLAVDDFGTGYSSLGYLSRFPVDMLKVDRSFVSRLEENDEALALVAAIVGLGDTLGLATVAEGIEEPEQLAFLMDLGCRFGQGFYFGRPQTVAEALESARGVGIPAVPRRPV